MNYWYLDKEVSIKGDVFHVCSILNYAGSLFGIRKITITDNKNYYEFIVWADDTIGRIRKSRSF